MKRIMIISSMILLLAAPAVSAQEMPDRRWSVDVSAAYPGNMAWNGVGQSIGQGIGEIFAVILTFGLYKPGQGYERTENNILPAFALQGGYQVLPWLQVTGDLYYHYATSRYFTKEADVDPAKSIVGNRISLLPGAKFTYLNKGIFHMYSTVSLGAAMAFSSTTVTTTNEETGDKTSETTPDNGVKFAFQLTPLGFAFGNDFYGFLDMGLGSEYSGLRAGIGYRF